MKIMLRFAATILLAGLLIGTAYAKPEEVPESAVQNCKFLRQIIGSSGYGKKNDWKPFAKANAIKKAGAAGATHIVWREFKPIGAFNGEAIGRAYSCNE